MQKLDYTHDPAGRITSVTWPNQPNESWIYTLDTLDRLTFADNAGSTSLDQTFAYDRSGNMVSNSRLGNYTYPAPTGARPHAPLTAGPARSYVYDDNGNAKRNGPAATTGTQSYSWDGENRLLSVAITGGTTTTFTYGPDGERIKKVTGSSSTFYFGSDIELSGGVWTIYPIPDAVRVSSGSNAGTTWLVRDHSQSIRLRFDSSGALSEASYYRPYGEPKQSGSTPLLTTSKSYIGEKRDAETGLLYLHARTMDPLLGRFISSDPAANSYAHLNCTMSERASRQKLDSRSVRH